MRGGSLWWPIYIIILLAHTDTVFFRKIGAAWYFVKEILSRPVTFCPIEFLLFDFTLKPDIQPFLNCRGFLSLTYRGPFYTTMSSVQTVSGQAQWFANHSHSGLSW